MVIILASSLTGANFERGSSQRSVSFTPPRLYLHLCASTKFEHSPPPPPQKKKKDLFVLLLFGRAQFYIFQIYIHQIHDGVALPLRGVLTGNIFVKRVKLNMKSIP